MMNFINIQGNNKKYLLLFFFLLTLWFNLYSNSHSHSIMQTESVVINHHFNFTQNYQPVSYHDYINNNQNMRQPRIPLTLLNVIDLGKLDHYEYKKKENLVRRAEILFFGSLTFVAFGGWIFFSIFNVMIYNEPFGKLRQDQFLPLYLGSSIISIAVVFSDLMIHFGPKLKEKNIEFY